MNELCLGEVAKIHLNAGNRDSVARRSVMSLHVLFILFSSLPLVYLTVRMCLSLKAYFEVLCEG